MLDPAQRAGQQRTAAIESVAVNGLPVMGDAPGVLTDQVGFELRDGLGAGLGPALKDRLAESDEPGVGMHLEKQPAGFDEKGFQVGDL